jgi:hypothetical protein
VQDTLLCPICQEKLRNIKTFRVFDHLEHQLYTERTCSRLNHMVMFFTNEQTKQVDFLKMSLNPKYSRFLEVNFLDQTCRVSLMNENVPDYIQIPKMVELDFPSLTKLKEKIELYATLY